MSLLSDLLGSLVEMPAKFATVATHDPLAALMLLVGGLLLLVSIGYFGILVLGSLLSLLTPSGGGRSHPQGR